MNYTSATSQPADGATAEPALEAELLEFCRDRLPKFKTPRSIDFLDDFPRDPSGKLQTPPARPVLGRPQLATGVIGVPTTLRSTDSA
jgi:acyl-coenzyme A synthetase/AMP-(fatty) acid ligase